MPFSNVVYPSFALTQIKTLLSYKYQGKLNTEVYYINHDFINFIGHDIYNNFSCDEENKKTGLEVEHNTDGLREWFFKHIAFPNHEDNISDYFSPYQGHDEFKNYILKKREETEGFLEKIIDLYDLDKADIVGFTSMFEQQVASIAMARLLKKRNPKIVTVMGGANCEHPAGEEIIKNTNVMDYVFSGMGLHSISKFIEYLLSGNINKLSEIKGLFSKRILEERNGDQDESFNYGEEFSLDGLLDLDYTSFFDSLNRHFPNAKFNPILFFETSRGCWWGEKSGCTFCGINGRKSEYRTMSSASAIQYFNTLFQYADRCNFYWATDSTIPRNYLTEVFPYLKIPENVRIFYEVRVDMTEDEIKKLAQYHITYVQAGIESLFTSSLKIMNKGTDVFDNIIFMKQCCIYGISVLWNILVGLSQEDETIYRKYLQLVPLLKHLPPPSGVWSVSFQRTSEYVTNPDKYGLNLTPIIDINQKIYPFDEHSLKNMAYFFDNIDKKSIFTLKNMKLIQKLSNLIENWKNDWLDKGHVFPALYFMKGRKKDTIVYDSRFGVIKYHNIQDEDLEILELLDNAMRIDELVSIIGNDKQEMIRERVKILYEQGFLIEENGKYLNLILRKEPVLRTPLIPHMFDTILNNNK